MVNGQRSTVNGQWSGGMSGLPCYVAGQWSWSVVSGQWSQWSMVNGQWSGGMSRLPCSWIDGQCQWSTIKGQRSKVKGQGATKLTPRGSQGTAEFQAVDLGDFPSLVSSYAICLPAAQCRVRIYAVCLCAARY
eukprot:3041781-Rhodomonas_salina.2